MSIVDKSEKIWEKRKCAIKGCRTHVGSGFSLHRFPREEELLLKWLEVTPVTSVSNQTLICSLHFKPSDYINLNAKKRQLKRDAVPSMCLSSEQILQHDHFQQEVDISDEETDTDHEFEIHMNNEEDTGESDREKLKKIEDEIHENIVTSEINFSENEKVCQFLNKAVQTETVMKNVEDKQVQTEKWTLVNLIKTDVALKAFTGIKFCVLEALVKSINLINNKVNDKHLCSVTERVVLTLCKLKLCLSYECLEVLFGISQSTANNYFVETVHLLHAVLEEAVYLPDKEETQQNMPECFKNFQDTRMVLDCTEMGVENSSCLQCRLKVYSHYKGRQTLKVLIGITPSGLISFCSKCYGGRASDKAIFLQNKLLDKFTPHEDAIMVDKGFLIQTECDARNIKLIRPPFAKQSQQMSFEDSLKTKGVAAARVHVERVMERLKNFGILKSVIDWSMTKCFDKIIVIICGLVNLGPPITDKSRYSA